MYKKTRWNMLYWVLALALLFSIIAVPKIAMSTINGNKDIVVTVEAK